MVLILESGYAFSQVTKMEELPDGYVEITRSDTEVKAKVAIPYIKSMHEER